MKSLFFVTCFGLCTFSSLLIPAQTTTKTDGFDASSISSKEGNPVGKGQTISSAFNPKDFQWEIAWPERLSQYDLVYKSPPVDPMQGIPLGNGDVAALLWCEDSRIIIVVNKSDLWDDATFTRFHNWSSEEEDYSTTLRHACRIVIDFKYPVFNTLYLSDFDARLNLANGSLNIEAESPFGKVSLNSFIDHKSGIVFYELGSDLNEDVPVDVILERFGSRTFSHWYSRINRDANIGLSGTEAFADDECVYITQKLSSGTFAVGGGVIKNNGLTVNYSREHSRCAVIQLSGIRQKNAQFAFSVTSPVTIDPVSELKYSLTSVRDKGMEASRQSHNDVWKSIWSRSFMDYGDDYLNNLWYLTMYYANASQGGKYPGRFNNGLWGWSRDVQLWNFYYHWNQQQLYWPLNAAGFHELINPYLNSSFNALPHAKNDAKEFFNASGAYFSDVTERRGYNSVGDQSNHTPVAEIALDFWRQYQYTGDKKFLKEKGLPFLIEAARFFESLLVKEADGLYHAKESTGYEGWIKLRDGLTDLVYSRVLFTTVLEALTVAETDLPEEERWREIASHLAPLPVIKTDSTEIADDGTGYKLKRGFFRGEACPTNEILAAGWGIKENKSLTVYYPVGDTVKEYFTATKYGLKLLDGIFPSVPSSPVFPSGLVGLGQKSSDLFNSITSTTLLYGIGVMAWDPVPIVMARLGLVKELSVYLERFPGRWQIYCNGWGHEGFEDKINKDAEWFFRTNMVNDVASQKPDKFPLPMWPFRHMCMESMSGLPTAMNESLLQSYDGTLRIAPAFPSDKTGRFTLHAAGGFIISSEIKSGEVKWIGVKSLFGNFCKLELPWSKAVIISNLDKKSQIISSKITEIRTKENEVILILPEGLDLRSWSVVSEKPLANENVRYHPSGKTQLGIPRMF